jgi:hypothetical protein
MAWEQLLGFIQEAREIEHKDATEAPVECPHCYTALREGPGGVLYCPWLPHYEYPRDGKLVQ